VKEKSYINTIASKTFILASINVFFKSILFVLYVFASSKLTCQAISGLIFLLVICYNCKKLGYFSYNCSELRHVNLKEIKKNKDKGALKSGKDYA
jgi:hypothetical protein